MYQFAARHHLCPQRPDGLINLFSVADTGMRTVEDLETALTAMVIGDESGQLWTTGETDISVSLQADRLVWTLDAAFSHRSPGPGADVFRDLHRRLTGLWLDVAQDLNAVRGRVLDEWSTDQVWALGIHDAKHPAGGGWPAELGWWAYMGPDRLRLPPPLPEVAARTRRLPGGAMLVTLLTDPAAVDPSRYEQLHRRWLRRR